MARNSLEYLMHIEYSLCDDGASILPFYKINHKVS